MTPETITWIWLIGGIALMLSEFLLPGLIVVFFGTGAIIIGLLRLIGAITGNIDSFMSWFFISLLLVLIFRRFLVRIFPSESSYQLVEDDVDAMGTIVDVVKTINEKDNDGRISYSGTTWPAVSNKGTIEAGKKARLLYRDNISWVVELYFESDEQ